MPGCWADNAIRYRGVKSELTTCMTVNKYYLLPANIYGRPDFPMEWRELDWLADLPRDTYFAINPSLPSTWHKPIDLPLGHSLYVITFHQERFDSDWISEQVTRITDAPVIILSDGSIYNFAVPSNVHFYTFHSWHHHMDLIMTMFPERQVRNNVKYKASTICNRVTQSKMLTFTALIEYLERSDILVKLSDWIEEKNVHNWQSTGNAALDELTKIFKTRYQGTTIEIDAFSNARDNLQTVTSNPWQPVLMESAVHFVGESYHYSLMQTDGRETIMPGPALSEKTFKCLVAGTPFVPVAQFECYKHLADLGLQFDYGDIDLSWDLDPGNLTRLAGLVKMIQSLKQYSIDDIMGMTKRSSEHNTDHIWSRAFDKLCRDHNEIIANEILDKFK